MVAGSLFRALGAIAPAVEAAAASLHDNGDDWAAAAAGAGAASAATRRVLVEEGGNGLSTGTQVAYIIISVILVVVSGLMAGLVLGLLSLDTVDLEVAKRTGNDKQRWLVARVEPFTRDPHYVMCALVVVNAACNTALPLFIDRLLNPLAAILISVTAVLLFAEIAPQAVCKRYGLEIGAYCSWLVRALMLLTFPISLPLGKLLDWLLGEESVLFRRQELSALVGLHAETQQDGSVGALTSDEVQVIQGALDMASKTAGGVMTPLNKVFMLSDDAVITKQLLAEVIQAGHSRVPVHERDNRQAILGLILVKELVLVDETAGVRVRDLRLREMSFLRMDIPLYDVMKIFRFGRRHMACLTRVASPDASNGGGTLSKGGSATLRLNHIFGRPSPALQTLGDRQVEEVVGIITIEDVLEELLQAEIVDETDQWEDNEQTVHVAPQVPLKELPPHLRRFLSPRRSMHHDRQVQVDSSPSAHSVVQFAGQASEGADPDLNAAADAAIAVVEGRPAVTVVAVPPTAPAASWQHHQIQHNGAGLVQLTGQANDSVGGAAAGGAVSLPIRRAPSPSLGAAAAASALTVAGGPSSGDPTAMAAALAAGVRAAELQRASSTASNGGAGGAGSTNPPRRPPLPRGAAAAAAAAAPAAVNSRLSGGGGGRVSEGGSVGVPGDARAATAPLAPPGSASFGQQPQQAAPAHAPSEPYVTVELGEMASWTTSDETESDAAHQQRPLVKPGSRNSGAA